jgi:hypothetical protein
MTLQSSKNFYSYPSKTVAASKGKRVLTAKAVGKITEVEASLKAKTKK